MRGGKPGPGTRIRWRLGRRLWTIRTARRQYQAARGKGGFRRTSWDDSLEIVAASLLYTAKKYGPDRVAGFSPIPAMSMLSYAAGSRFLQLFGGPSPEFLRSLLRLSAGIARDVGRKDRRRRERRLVQQQVHRNHRQQPQHDAHARRALRRRGAQQRYRSWSCCRPISAKSRATPTGGFRFIPEWMRPSGWPWTTSSCRNFTRHGRSPYFVNYLKKFSDSPFLVVLDKSEKRYTAGPLPSCRPPRAICRRGEWRLEVSASSMQRRAAAHAPRRHRQPLAGAEGAMEPELKDDLDGTAIDPLLTLLESARCANSRDVCGFGARPDVPRATCQ